MHTYTAYASSVGEECERHTYHWVLALKFDHEDASTKARRHLEEKRKEKKKTLKPDKSLQGVAIEGYL